MVSEVDHIQAMRNQLARQAEDKKQQLKNVQDDLTRINDHIKALDVLRSDWTRMLNRTPMPSSAPVPAVIQDAGKVPITECINRFIAETGRREFSAADIKAYMISLGHEVKPSTYNSIHESLRRRVKNRELQKVGTKFKMKGE